MKLQKMRLRRIERGALTLASAEVKFQIDTETHDPLDIGIMFFILFSGLLLISLELLLFICVYPLSMICVLRNVSNSRSKPNG